MIGDFIYVCSCDLDDVIVVFDVVIDHFFE